MSKSAKSSHIMGLENVAVATATKYESRTRLSCIFGDKEGLQ
jgi:hypothetical protein